MNAPQILSGRIEQPWSGAVAAIRQRLSCLLRAVWVWHERARQRWHLQFLSDHMLRDIGLTRADVLAEASKPFWRA